MKKVIISGLLMLMLMLTSGFKVRDINTYTNFTNKRVTTVITELDGSNRIISTDLMTGYTTNVKVVK